MKKVGIITFHFANNFGAVLQAFALLVTIRKFNYEVEIINYEPVKSNKSFLKERKLISVCKYYLRKIYNFIPDRKRIKNFNEFRAMYLKTSDKKFKDTLELINEKPVYNYYICGSDQIWNYNFINRFGYSYFLDFVINEGKKISYAASIGQINKQYNEIYRSYLKDFDYISVREASAKKYIESIIDKDIEIVLDPTLLLTRGEWENIATVKEFKEKYILVYDLIKNPDIVSFANRVSNETGCKIISFTNKKGYDNWLTSFYTYKLTEFVGLFLNAEYIITSSFHGTVFSIISNKPFYTIIPPDRGSRMIDLLFELQLDRRIVFNINDIMSIDKNIDYAKVNLIIDNLREQSIKFLKKSLDISL